MTRAGARRRRAVVGRAERDDDDENDDDDDDDDEHDHETGEWALTPERGAGGAGRSCCASWHEGLSEGPAARRAGPGRSCLP